MHGVVRWRLVDLCQWVFEEFKVAVSTQTMSRELRAMDYRKLSARPRHHAQAANAIEDFKKVPGPPATPSTRPPFRVGGFDRAFRGLPQGDVEFRPDYGIIYALRAEIRPRFLPDLFQFPRPSVSIGVELDPRLEWAPGGGQRSGR